jgi:hypothetical protein
MRWRSRVATPSRQAVVHRLSYGDVKAFQWMMGRRGQSLGSTLLSKFET